MQHTLIVIVLVALCGCQSLGDDGPQAQPTDAGAWAPGAFSVAMEPIANFHVQVGRFAVEQPFEVSAVCAQWPHAVMHRVELVEWTPALITDLGGSPWRWAVATCLTTEHSLLEASIMLEPGTEYEVQVHHQDNVIKPPAVLVSGLRRI